MDIRLPEKNTATRNSFEVFLKALAGFGIGFIPVIWGVPGVPEAITSYFQSNWQTIAISIGLPVSLGTGLINLILDIRKKGLRNY